MQCVANVVELWLVGGAYPYPRCSVHRLLLFATNITYSLSIVNTSPIFASCKYTQAAFFGHTLLPDDSPAAGVESHGSPSTVTTLHPALPVGHEPVPAAIVGVALSEPDKIVDVYGPSPACAGELGEKYLPATQTVSVFPDMNVV
jgi:hypothetical protein